MNENRRGRAPILENNSPIYDRATAARNLFPRSIFLVSIYALFALALLTNFRFQLWAPEDFGLVFNDMAQRLLHLDWTIDQKVIMGEAFAVNDQTYTYFGVFPAIFRLPLLVFGRADIVISRLSCLVALALFVWCNIRVAHLAIGASGGGKQEARLSTAWIIALLMSGPQIYLLSSAKVFHESIFWAAALAASFNYVVLRKYFRGEWPEGRSLNALATLAGLALLTRVPEGVGLYVAFSVFWLRCLWKCYSSERRDWTSLWAAALIATTLVATTGLVNAGRWGNPLVFSPQDKYVATLGDNHAQMIRDEQGMFEAVRVPFATVYYATGLPMKEPFADFMNSHYQTIEGPRIPMLLVSPLALVLAGWGGFSLFGAAHSRMAVPAILIGAQLVTALVILGLPWLTLRYTLDLWGGIGAAATIGLYEILQKKRSRMFHGAFLMLAVIGVVGSMLALVRYKIVDHVVPNEVRFAISQKIQPLICPETPAATKIEDPRLPLVTPSCPPFW